MSYEPGLTIELSPKLALQKIKHRVVSCQILNKIGLITSIVAPYIVPVYHIYYFLFATKSLPFNITFEDSLFRIAMLMIKSDIFHYYWRCPANWQPNTNVEIV